MAEVIQQEDLDEKKPGQQQVQQAGQGVQAPAGVALPAGGGQQQSTIKSFNPNSQRGTGYTNIQRLVQANSGNKLGQAVGGGIQQVGQQTKQQLNQAQQQFQQQAQQNQFNTAQNQQLTQNVLQDPTQYTQFGLNTPESQQASQFQRLISGQYQGPQTLQNADQLQAQTQDATQLGQAIGSQAGRIGLLQRFVGTPQYKQGQQTLDALLLGQTGSPQLAAAKRSALGIQAQTGNALAGAQAIGQQFTNEAQEFGKNLQGQVGQSVTDQDARLQQQATELQAQRDKDLENVRQQFSSGQLSSDMAAQLGINEGQKTYGIDANAFLNPSAIKASAQNVASEQDYARLNALRKLAGGFAPTSAQEALGKYAGQDTQAGELAKNPVYNLDKEGFQKAYGVREQDYKQQLEPAQQSVAKAKEILDLANIGLYGGNPNMTKGKALQLLQQKYPEALRGSISDQASAAAAAFEAAKQNLNQTMSGLNQAYGTNTFGIKPQV